MIFIAPHQREYLRSHPVVFWLCIGLVIVGAVGAVAPHLIGQSAASMVLPGWLRTAFYADYAIGGVLSVIGMARGLARLEASGMVLLATGFLIQFLTAAYLLHSSAIAGIFLLALSVGCFLRSRHLMTWGYPPKWSS